MNPQNDYVWKMIHRNAGREMELVNAESFVAWWNNVRTVFTDSPGFNVTEGAD